MESGAPSREIEQIEDDELRLLLLFCHPSLPEESQIALTLRIACGLGVDEIAKGVISTPAAIARRITRAKAHLKGLPDLQDLVDLEARMPSCLRVIYLMFNEGYASTSSAGLVRSDVCAEAILLLHRLLGHELGDRPEAHALMALMLFHASRLPARIGPGGDLCLLAQQDRSLWDGELIVKGLWHLGRSARGDVQSTYHCEAAIAAIHASARTYAETEWLRLLQHYDDLARLNPTGLVLLNRAVVIAECFGPSKGLEQIEAASADSKILGYYLYPATKGELLARLGRAAQAEGCLQEALELASNPAEQAFIQRRISYLAQTARQTHAGESKTPCRHT